MLARLHLFLIALTEILSPDLAAPDSPTHPGALLHSLSQPSATKSQQHKDYLVGQSTTPIQAATRRRTPCSICRSGPQQPAEETRVSLPSLLPRSRNSCSCTRYWIVTAHNLLSPFHSVCEKSSPGAKLITFCRSRAIRPGLVCQWRYRP